MNGAHRSLLYAGLAELLRSGFAWERALAEMARDLPPRARRRVEQAATDCLSGTAPDVAGARHGLWTGTDAALIRAGLASGKVDDVLVRLARWHGDGAICGRQLKARFWMPAFVLLLAAAAEPLAPLLAREIGAFDYFGILVRSLASWAVVIGMIVFAARWVLAPAFAKALSERVREVLPGRAMLETLRQRRYLFALETALAAGLPADAAMELAAQAIVHPRARASATTAAQGPRAGQPLAEALASARRLVSTADRELLRTADATGDPVPVIGRRLRGLDADAARHCEIVAEWLPRIFYAAAVTWFVL
ncbi:MAG TPA: type II secretion system F family protein [Steroidobacteraceae bacterium]|nr:type II secretion system F family protein [Steroidobacteraceae bacterium]